MRIIAGKFKGRRLAVPKGRIIRPATDQIREALFNILAGNIAGGSFLDLFAGSGAVGLEALSRGATRVVFVERSSNVLPILQENMRGCEMADETCRPQMELFPMAVSQALPQLSGRVFDFIFLGPPYREMALYLETLTQLAEHRLLAPAGTVLAEQSKEMPAPQSDAFELVEQRKYGGTCLDFYQWRRVSG